LIWTQLWNQSFISFMSVILIFLLLIHIILFTQSPLAPSISSILNLTINLSTYVHACPIPILPTYLHVRVKLAKCAGWNSSSCGYWQAGRVIARHDAGRAVGDRSQRARERQSEQERARSIDGVDNPHRRSVHVDDGLTTARGSAWMIVVLLRRETRRDGCNDHSQSLLWCYAEARYFAVERCLSDRHFVCLSITTKHASNRLVEFLLLPAWYSQISIVFATNRRY